MSSSLPNEAQQRRSTTSFQLRRQMFPFLDVAVGDILLIHKKKSNKLRIRWEIPDFIAWMKHDEMYRIFSPMFLFKGCTWRLEAIPSLLECSPQPLKFYVAMMDSDTDTKKIVTCTVGILTAYFGIETMAMETEAILDPSDVLKHVEVDFYIFKFQKRTSELVPSGTLTFVCIMEIEPQVQSQSSQTSDINGTYRLVQDFSNLLLTGHASDATIRVRGQDFPVHKTILEARTPALSSMLRSDTSEKSSVNIEDWTPATFRRFLHYVYTGGLEDLTSDNVTELYELANEYKMELLMEGCLDCIKKGLSVENFCSALALAVDYGEWELTQLITDFFKENMEQIIRKGEWQDFLCENPIQANELLVRAHTGARK